jgi:small subunit ribosomal protein S18
MNSGRLKEYINMSDMDNYNEHFESKGKFGSKRDSGDRRGIREKPDDRLGSRKQKVFFKRKVCRFCTGNAKINYLDDDTLRKFTTERGKIIPRRITGTCAKHQRGLAKAIKRARILALLPFVEKFK